MQMYVRSHFVPFCKLDPFARIFTVCSLPFYELLFDNTIAMGTITKTDVRLHRRTAKKYVNVFTLITDEGRFDPVFIVWPDGRVYWVDEVLERGAFGNKDGRARTARYRIRIGEHETFMYLEKIEGNPNRGESSSIKWWVKAKDASKLANLSS